MTRLSHSEIRRFAAEEPISTPANAMMDPTTIVAAIPVAERLGPDARVVTLTADSGLKYLSTDVYGVDKTRSPAG